MLIQQIQSVVLKQVISHNINTLSKSDSADLNNNKITNIKGSLYSAILIRRLLDNTRMGNSDVQEKLPFRKEAEPTILH